MVRPLVVAALLAALASCLAALLDCPGALGEVPPADVAECSSSAAADDFEAAFEAA